MEEKDRIIIMFNRNATGNQPKFKGYITMNKVEYEFGAWEAKNGKKDMFTGTVKPKQFTKDRPQVIRKQASGWDEVSKVIDDEIPFDM